MIIILIHLATIIWPFNCNHLDTSHKPSKKTKKKVWNVKNTIISLKLKFEHVDCLCGENNDLNIFI